MRTSLASVLLVSLVGVAVGQRGGGFFGLGNLFRGFGGGGGGGLFGLGGSRFGNGGGTLSPQATGKDELYPRDCGRNTGTGRGLLCLPDGLLCQQRTNRPGTQKFNNHNYWFSWQSTDSQLRTATWDWFNARNYCRKRCMDLVSFETRDEYEWVKGNSGGASQYWTSGRLCDFDGCDRSEFFPKHINGWFWSANQAKLNPTNSSTLFQEWSNTGNPRQPDGNGRGDESCLAVKNGADGSKWYDEVCVTEMQLVCEDVEQHLGYARQQFPNINIP